MLFYICISLFFLGLLVVNVITRNTLSIFTFFFLSLDITYKRTTITFLDLQLIEITFLCYLPWTIHTFVLICFRF